MVSTTRAVASALSLAGGDATKFAGALKNLSPAMMSQLVASGQLTKEQIKAAIATDVLTDEEKEAINTQVLHTTTTTGAAGATKLFDFSLKGLWATMKAFAVAHPAITTIAAIAAVAALVAGAIDWANTSIDEHNARLEELQSEASELQSELDSLNQELDTFADRLDELRNKKVAGTLTLVEKSELEDLERRNQLLQQYKDLIQDDLDANTADKLSHAGAVLGGKYSALAWSQDPFAASAGPKELVAGDSATAPEILAAHAQLLQDLQAQEEAFIQQYNNDEITKPILDEWRANIESRRKVIKNDTKILIQDLSASAKAVIDSGVTSGAEFDLAKEFLDAVEQWQLVDATVTEKIAYLAQNAPEAVKKIASQADGVLTEAKVAASESLQGFVDLAIQLGVIPDASAESLAALTSAIAGVGKTAASSGVEVKTFESIVSSLSAGVGAITAAQEDMAETGYLSADSVKAIKEAGLDNYLVACQGGYKLATGALNDYLEAQKAEHRNALNTAKEAAEQVIANETGKTQAYNRTTKAIINQLQVLQSEKLIKMNQLEAQFLTENGLRKGEGSRVLNDGYIDQYTSQTKRDYTTLRNAYLSDQKVLQDLVKASNQWDITEMAINTVKRDYTKTDTTDKNKSEFEEEYAKQKHQLELGKQTLKEFNDWLKGDKGYKDYFKDKEKYAAEWRKYEKEVFDNSMQLHEQEATNLDHTIEMLKLQGKSEQDILAAYREKQLLLKNARDLVYDFLKAQGLSEAQIKSNGTFQELTRQVYEVNDAIQDTLETLFEAASGHINDLFDLTEDLVRHETEEMIDAYEKQKDAFSEIVDAKKEMLQLTKREQEYNDKVAESTKDIAKLQSRIDALSMDDSRQAKMERAKLEEELAELQKELASTQTDHYIEVTEDALDKEEKDYHDLMDSKIKELEDFLDDNEAVTKATLQRLDSMNEDLFNDLLGYAKHYTDTTGDELTAMWSTALQAAEKYGSYTNSMKVFSDGDAPTSAQSIMKKMFANQNAWASTSDPEARKRYDQANLQLGQQLASELGTKVWRENGTWYIGNGDLLFADFVSSNSTAKALVKQMQDNGEAWGKAKSDAERKVFEDANEQIGKQLQQMLGVPVWRQNGRWYIGEGEELYKVYGFHTGGVVGRAGSVSPKADELFALLQNDEVVMSRRMVDNAYDFLTGIPRVVSTMLQNPLSFAAQAVSKGREYVLNISAPLNIEGVLPKDEILSVIKQYPRKVAEVVSEQLRKI